jgi:cytochrome oxidase assembly protein ShyY1
MSDAVELITAILVLGAVGMATSAFAYWQARRSHAHIEQLRAIEDRLLKAEADPTSR